MSLHDLFKKEIHQSLIGGVDVRAKGRGLVEYISPLTGLAWKKYYLSGEQEAEYAISIAQETYTQWSQVPPPERARYLRKVADILKEHRDLFAEVMAMEMGKPLREGRGEVDYTAAYFSWFAGEAERIYGLSIPSQFPNKNLKIIYEPVGVCAVITPWNFPIAMAARKIAPALAAGCTVVAKPSSETPLSMLLLAHACHQAGIPPGAINVVIGPEKEIGHAFLSSSVIRKLSFTGSTAVGKYLYRESAETLKKLSLELGGHAPLLVFDDADIDKAVAGTLVAKFRNTGQTCVCANRILVQEKIYDAYMERFLVEVKKLKVGNPRDEDTNISVVLHPDSQKKVKEHVKDALDKGAKGLLLSDDTYRPQVISGVTPAMKIFREETFGPVAAVTKFASFEEGISLANASEYGLASYVFTETMKTANAAVSKLEYGIIGVNDGLPSTAQASFGGVKNSGIGREGGPTGLREYLVEKYVSIAF